MFSVESKSIRAIAVLWSTTSCGYFADVEVKSECCELAPNGFWDVYCQRVFLRSMQLYNYVISVVR